MCFVFGCFLIENSLSGTLPEKQRALNIQVYCFERNDFCCYK